MVFVKKKKPKFYLTANEKCMWTSLNESLQEGFPDGEIVYETAEILDLYKRTNGLENATGFTIVRNPYSRIVSFFYERLKINAKKI